MIEQAGQVATATVESLKSQPLALALIVINVLFLIAAGLFVFYIGAAIRAERLEHTTALREVMQSCFAGKAGT